MIPHYDNAEGGHHDTRFCYLGEQRLAAMERELPDEAFVLGVDEHTAVLLDPAARTATVVGNGTMTIRRHGRERGAPDRQRGRLRRTLASRARAAAGSAPSVRLRHASAPTGGRAGAGLAAARPTDGSTREFDAALAGATSTAASRRSSRWSRPCWTGRPTRSPPTRATTPAAQLRGMVVRLGELAAVGARDPRVRSARSWTRCWSCGPGPATAKDFATSDWVRDQLAEAGVEVRDTADGVEWELA